MVVLPAQIKRWLVTSKEPVPRMSGNVKKSRSCSYVKFVLIAAVCVIGVGLLTFPCFAKKEFPEWSEKVFAEVTKRHGDKASARLRDVYELIRKHLNDPVDEQLFFLFREMLAGFFGGHLCELVVCQDSFDERALRRIAGNDGCALVSDRQRAFSDIQPQVGLPLALVGTVTEKAFVREDRPDVPVEFDTVFGSGCTTEERKQQQSIKEMAHGHILFLCKETFSLFCAKPGDSPSRVIRLSAPHE